MAGFGAFTEPRFQVNPPLLTKAIGSYGYLPMNVDRARERSSFLSTPQSFASSPDYSDQHQANVYMAQMSAGDTQSQQIPGYPSYGFSANDWNDINRYLSNPLDNNNVSNYMKIVGRLGNTASNFQQWTPDMQKQWATDFPIRMASGFNLVPPPILQNWSIPVSGPISNMRF